ncbi:uncharacterized protein LOC112568227 isoform X2 [Pomacea canaliculata]|uniref:uncharacterized protein LOC112568227 isoform X2 n=1 Tax=Pomacea canaliculata TaxID=400727 RepID=UPI000D73E659|nr:uncharacterized protein LOC112568227 isoform X2 [Pomacea canaliculata]
MGSYNKYASEMLREVDCFMQCHGIDDTCDLPPGSDHFTVGPKSMMAFLVDYIPTIRAHNLVQDDSSAQSQQGSWCKPYNVQWEPRMNWHRVKIPITPNIARDWYSEVEPYDRVMTIVWHSIMIHPTQDVTAMTDPRMQHVIDAMWQLEGDIYQVAQNKIEYTKRMKMETSKMRKYIVQERRRYGDQLLQDVSARWFFDYPVQPSIPKQPRQEQENLSTAAATFVPQSLENASATNPSLFVEKREKTAFMAETEKTKGQEPASCGTSFFCCRICFETFEEIASKNQKIYATVCGHVFCEDCIQKCFKHRQRCPTCQKPLVPFLDAYPLKHFFW